jgi:TonB family protein
LLRELTEDRLVKVGFTVMPDGTTSDLKILTSSTRTVNNAVLAAVREWKYEKIDVPVTTEIELVFKAN